MVKIYLFLRLPGPFGLGHTGVGYEVREMSGSAVIRAYSFYGGVENPGGSAVVVAGLNNGGWSGFGANGNVEMLGAMRAKGYTNYKFEAAFRPVDPWRLDQAWRSLSRFPQRGYSVQGNNCMNASYEVLVQLGAPAWRGPSRTGSRATNLPTPSTGGLARAACRGRMRLAATSSSINPARLLNEACRVTMLDRRMTAVNRAVTKHLDVF